MDRARGRLAVISAHLIALDAIDVSDVLEIFPVLNSGGKLRAIDEKNELVQNLVVSDDGTVMASDFKKISFGNGKRITLYDPGCINTAPARSTICYINEEESILRYRGYNIQDLTDRSTFTEVTFLLIYGRLPLYLELREWEESISRQSPIPDGVLNIIESAPRKAHPICVLLSALSQLSVISSCAGQGSMDERNMRYEEIVRVLGMVPTIVATIYSVLNRRSPVLPSESFSYTENFLKMLEPNFRRRINCGTKEKLIKILDVLFILHAEHGINSSTAAARHLASTGTNVYAVLAGAAGALYVPGANEAAYKMFVMIECTNNIPQFIEDVKNRKYEPSGFGRCVHKSEDPRVETIARLIKEVSPGFPSHPLEVAHKVEAAARGDAYFREMKLYPNVHFYTAVFYRVMEFDEKFFTLFFSVPRMAGFLAHWLESLHDPDTKIIRPLQVYSGELLQRYVPIEERGLQRRP